MRKCSAAVGKRREPRRDRRIDGGTRGHTEASKTFSFLHVAGNKPYLASSNAYDVSYKRFPQVHDEAIYALCHSEVRTMHTKTPHCILRPPVIVYPGRRIGEGGAIRLGREDWPGCNPGHWEGTDAEDGSHGPRLDPWHGLPQSASRGVATRRGAHPTQPMRWPL